MPTPPPTRFNRPRRGFTLIELLVVISIIALLVGILLPALSAARRTTRDMRCLSNHRQMGQGVYGYAYDYDSELPPSFINNNNAGGSGRRTAWDVLITTYIEASSDHTLNQLNAAGRRTVVMNCPSAAIDGALSQDTANLLHFSANLLLMPSYTGSNDPDQPYRLDYLRRPSEVLMIADAGQRAGDGNSYSGLDMLDGGNARDARPQSTQYFDADATDNNASIDEGLNRDGRPDTVGNIADLRWRHGAGGQVSGSDGGAVNLTWSDGHATTVRRGLLLKRNVRPDR